MSKSVRVLELESSHESCKSCISLYLESPGVVRQFKVLGFHFIVNQKKNIMKLKTIKA